MVPSVTSHDKNEATDKDTSTCPWSPEEKLQLSQCSSTEDSPGEQALAPCHGAVCTVSDHSPILTFVKYRSRFLPERRVVLRNSLLPAIGFIELGNAGDFAANVWKISPPPKYVIILMAIGGTLALSVLYFVIWDAILSWQNICGLREERKHLRQLRRDTQDCELHNGPCSYGQSHARESLVRAIDCFLNVNIRELGTEIVDRFGMDILMGSGAFIVGIGTFLAIAGENPRIFLASDLMTGYIGNSPCALYGLLNFAWAVFVWVRAQNHTSRVNTAIDQSDETHNIKKRLKEKFRDRLFKVKVHSITNGATGLVAGAASMVTYTHWQAYVVLIICLFSSLFANWFWRVKVGYNRLYVRDLTGVDQTSLIQSLAHAHRHQMGLGSKKKNVPVQLLVPDPNSLSDLLYFILAHGLFEDFCMRAVCNTDLIRKHFSQLGRSLVLRFNELVATEESKLKSRLTGIAYEMLQEEAAVCFEYEERWLFEAIGCYVSSENEGRTPQRRH